jgi:hypothetical protein
VRVEKKNVAEGQPEWPGPFRLPGEVGTQKDRAHCPFCGVVFIAKVEYIRAHVGGLSNVGVAICKGTTRRPEEGDTSLAARTAEYVQAKALLLAKVAELKVEADAKGVCGESLPSATHTAPQRPSASWRRRSSSGRRPATLRRRPATLPRVIEPRHAVPCLPSGSTFCSLFDSRSTIAAQLYGAL